MSNTIIQVENLGKKYLIKHQQQSGYTALRDVITEKVKSLGKRIISPWNHKQLSTHSTTEEFWALKDISFKVKQGEVIGIIGRNGAGKSTLLKIISRITEPTKGRIRINGRVASLLEVGTGFHPELTGRENVFLNGAILGMGKAEIKRKFDEIVVFAEIEKFLDTPVKRYSRGMYVRLAFAVAAHLEPEILIIDEVLAVGDVAFQKKCLGKIGDVAKGGRTVLFVSHNMGVINSLCDRCLCLHKGMISECGATSDVIKAYLLGHRVRNGRIKYKSPNDNFDLRISSVEITLPKHPYEPIDVIPYQQPFDISVNVEAKRDAEAVIGIRLTNGLGEIVTTIHTIELGKNNYDESLMTIKRGENNFSLTIQNNCLRPGTYSIGFSVFNRKLNKTYDSKDSELVLTISNHGNYGYFDERQAGLFFLQDVCWRKEHQSSFLRG